MSDDWMASRMVAGEATAARLMKTYDNPVPPAVELGKAAGAMVCRIHDLYGEDAAKDFLKAMVAVYNQETLRLNISSEVVVLRSSCDGF